jgi:hypothetical protein
MSKEYNQMLTIVKTALYLESIGCIVPSIQLLAQGYNLPTKAAFLKSCCQRILELFLLKACFYLDLRAQTKKNE